MKFQIFTFALLLSFFSCQNKFEKSIEGWWSIDSIYFNKKDIQYCLNRNLINFKFNEEIQFPIQVRCESDTLNARIEWGEINFIESCNSKDSLPLNLNITIENEVFDGTHKIIFYRDQSNKLLKIRITSDKLYLICRKGLFDYDSNLGLLDELEKASTAKSHGSPIEIR